MKTYTLDDIRALKPCYDPTRYAPEDWSGTLVDILRAEQIPADDRIWVVVNLLDDRTNRLFAVWCARNVLAQVHNPDPHSVSVCDVAERFANGEATQEELRAARYAAWDVARDAAWAAALAVARDAAGYAAWYAAWAAAWDAASDAARDAARYAARDAQIQHLIEMIEALE